MKYASTIAGALLGFLFVAFSLMVLLKLVPIRLPLLTAHPSPSSWERSCQPDTSPS